MTEPKPRGETTAPQDGASPPVAKGAARSPEPRPSKAASTPKGEKRLLWRWGLGAILGIGLGLLLFLQPWASRAELVVPETAALGPVTRVLAVNGRIAARHSVEMRSVVSGVVTHVLVAEGDTVQDGTELVRLDTAAQQAVARQAIAGLDAALVSQAQANNTYERTKALDANVTRLALDTATRNLEAARQEVARATALVDQAHIQLANFTIHAPIKGTVLVLNVDQGASVTPSSPLLTLADLEDLVVETDVDEAYATQITIGLPAVLQLAGEADTRDGQVSFVSRRVDATTGGLAVRLAFATDVSAPVGLTVTANIVVETQAAALTVPRSAIVSDGDALAVYVVVDGVARWRDIRVIDWPAARLIVTQGLLPGEIVISDATGLSDGLAVRWDAP